MLVLSRRPDEKILLPTVPAVIKVISIQAGHARLGIDAPPHVPILREELCDDSSLASSADLSDGGEAAGCLHSLALGLALLRRQLAGAGAAVRTTVDRMERDLHGLRAQMASAHSGLASPGLALTGGAGV